MVAVTNVLGGLDGAIVLESDVVALVVDGGQGEVSVVLLDLEEAPATTLSGVQVSLLVDTEVTSGGSLVLKLDVGGLGSSVDTVDGPLGSSTVATISLDVAITEPQAVARGLVGEDDGVSAFPVSGHDEICW